MVEKDIPLDDTGAGKLCKCGRWRSWADYEVRQLCECGRRLAMVRRCSICRTETTGAPLCDRCAHKLRRDCQLVHLAIAARACVGSGTIANLRRDEEKLKGHDEGCCSICYTWIDGAILCAKCAEFLRQDNDGIEVRLTEGAFTEPGDVERLRRNKALLAKHDEWVQQAIDEYIEEAHEHHCDN